MENTKKEVVTSSLFDFVDLPSIHEYGTETFGIRLADNFIAEIYSNLDLLTMDYLLHPECRHLKTKKIPKYYFRFLSDNLQNN